MAAVQFNSTPVIKLAMCKHTAFCQLVIKMKTIIIIIKCTHWESKDK